VDDTERFRHLCAYIDNWHERATTVENFPVDATRLLEILQSYAKTLKSDES
jgi:hypothetical protein